LSDPAPIKSDVTLMLAAVTNGDDKASEQLLPIVYGELRRLANHLMAREPSGHTLQPTALVHEAYMKLVSGEGPAPNWENRRHFFNAAALAMRRVLLDRSRRVKRDRHGGGSKREEMDAVDIPAVKEFGIDAVEDLDALLDQLGTHNARWAEIVQLRFFVGLTIEQTAEMLGIAPTTVKADWNFARAWLGLHLKQRMGQ
jgi:RNA polymerase sigma factor (TIGR02999 family)